MLQWLTEVPSESAEVVERRSSDINSSLSHLRVSPLSPLEELPLEILQSIISFLPAQSVLRLRRCSKTLKSRIVLEQAFWRTQLLTGRLVPHIWELSETSEVALKEALVPSVASSGLDWKGLAEKLAHKDTIIQEDISQVTNESMGFRNRCRIWALVNQLIMISDY